MSLRTSLDCFLKGDIKMIKKISSIALLFMLTGCGSAVTVNNVSIPNDKITSIVKAQEQLMGKVSGDQEKSLRINVINNLIDQNLLIQEAIKLGIQVSENDITTKYTETLKNWKTGGELQKSLKAQGYTEGNMKEMVKNQLLIQGLSNSLITVTDEQLLNYFKTHAYEYATYTTQKAEGQSSAEAQANLNPSKETLLGFAQLPYQVQQNIQKNILVMNESQIINLNSKSFQAIKITAIKNQSLEGAKEQVKQSFKSQNEIANTQNLLAQLKAQANIKTN